MAIYDFIISKLIINTRVREKNKTHIIFVYCFHIIVLLITEEIINHKNTNIEMTIFMNNVNIAYK